jgi:hypothetical protein
MTNARRCKKPIKDLKLKSLASSENWENVELGNNVEVGVILWGEFILFVICCSGIDFSG